MDNLQKQRSLDFMKSCFILTGILIVSLLSAQLFTNPLLHIFGMNDIFLVMAEMKKGNFLENLNGLRIVFGVAHIFTFFVPAFLFVVFFTKKPFSEYTYTRFFPTLATIGLALLITLICQPIAMSLFYLNNFIPEHWTSPDAHEQTMLLLKMQTPTDLIINLLVIGVLAGVGEELLFRGVIQRIFAQRFQNIHLGIFISAIVFSLIHFEPNAFLPRMVLGGLLGYLFWWSGSLWIPIICHTLYNGIQVVLVYFNPEMLKETAPQNLDIQLLGLALVGVIALVPLCRFFIRYHQTTNLLTTSYLISNFEPSSSEDDETIL